MSLADKSTDLGATLSPSTCNDCTICRVIDCMRDVEGFPERYEIGQAPYSDELMRVHVVGLRAPDSHSNRFDDRLVVFYRPVDLESGEVLDIDVVGDRVDVPTIEAFLSDDALRRQLIGSDGQLPGQVSMDDAGRSCRLHIDWRLLLLTITTEPGYTKQTDGQVPMDAEHTGFIHNRAAVVQPGVYENSHRFFIHHWSKVRGYVALTQASKLDIRRAAIQPYLLERLRAETAIAANDRKRRTVWEKAWDHANGRLSAKVRAHERAMKKYESKKAKWDAYTEARDACEANGKRGKRPRRPFKKEPQAPREPEPAMAHPDDGDWLKTRLTRVLAASLSLQDGLNVGRSHLIETRVDHLGGDREDLADLRVDYVVSQNGDGKWTLEVHGIDASADGTRWRSLAENEIVVVNDHDNAGINIHRSHASRDERKVGNWSEGCQVFQNHTEFDQFRSLCALSKRCRCAKRRSGECESLAGPLTIDDLVFHYYAAESPWSERQRQLDLRKSMSGDDFLREHVLVGRRRETEFLDALEARIARIELTSPAEGPFSAPWKGSASRTRAVKKRIRPIHRDSLFPDEDEQTKGRWWNRLSDDLLDVLRRGVESDLNTDAGLRAQVDAEVDQAIGRLGVKSRKRPSEVRRVRRGAEAKALKSKEVRARVEEVEKSSLDSLLIALDAELRDLTEEMADRTAATIEEMKRRVEPNVQRFADSGLERCDLFGQCQERLTYSLAAPTR
ncbi:MAG: hypothetical protein KDC38_01335, partial [Planctomycetes bacterium]|nr:hypothetical protein [Planctomycetota bacterium]